jgi:guanine deaminase
MNGVQVVRGPLLNPRPDGSVRYFADGALVGDARGKILAAGAWSDVERTLPPGHTLRQADGILMPPMLDAHIHIPQHPIRGHFLAGIPVHAPGGPLLAGLERNVFPAEGRCANEDEAARVIAAFREDTLAHGVIGGAAYMTVHVDATRAALSTLDEFWSVGLVLMQRYCPEYLRTSETTLDADVASLADAFGRRVIVTDRFAGAVDSALRRRGVALAKRFGLRMQTHLSEQLTERAWTESLYPGAASYTDIYRRDGLLDCEPILAHCIHMRPEEYDMVAAAPGAAVAHCPVSNTLLGSGVMPLDEIVARKIPYAVCTDVGASPTTSLLCEIVQYLRVHQGRSRHATPSEALWRVTLAPAQILGLDERLGSFDAGKDFSFVEVTRGTRLTVGDASADEAILSGLLETDRGELARFGPGGETGAFVDRLAAGKLDVGDELNQLTESVAETARRLDAKVARVTLAGREVWRRKP